MHDGESTLHTLKEALVAIVCCIPRGRVASYGQLVPMVNELSGKSISAQMVGWQLSGMPEDERSRLPWWRVVNKKGVISTMKLGDKGWKQQQLLEKEGIGIVHATVIDIEELRWEFDGRREEVRKWLQGEG